MSHGWHACVLTQGIWLMGLTHMNGVVALVDLCQAGELLDRCVNLNTEKDTEEAHH